MPGVLLVWAERSCRRDSLHRAGRCLAEGLGSGPIPHTPMTARATKLYVLMTETQIVVDPMRQNAPVAELSRDDAANRMW